MSNIPQFDIATAALEHLELLNHSNRNPLEIAAQFRTLLRSKRNKKNEHSSNIDYTYMDYITTDATIRRRGCSHNRIDHQSKCQDLGTSSHSIDRSNKKSLQNRFYYPIINWKQLRKKQYEHKLEQFISMKFKTKDLTLSSCTSVSDKTESYTYSNISELRKNQSSSSSSSSIRTPSISPMNFPQSTYTISRLNSTSINNEDILFPIADCNLVIKPTPNRMSHFENFYNPNDLFCNNTEETICR